MFESGCVWPAYLCLVCLACVLGCLLLLLLLLIEGWGRFVFDCVLFALRLVMIVFCCVLRVYCCALFVLLRFRFVGAGAPKRPVRVAT